MHSSTLPIWAIILVTSITLSAIFGFFNVYIPKKSKTLFRISHITNSDHLKITTKPRINLWAIFCASIIIAIAASVIFIWRFNSTPHEQIDGIIIIIPTIIVIIMLPGTLLTIFVIAMFVRTLLIGKYYSKKVGEKVDVSLV